MALRSKFVQLTNDIVNIRAITDPTEDEDDNETVHGFIVNRTVPVSSLAIGPEISQTKLHFQMSLCCQCNCHTTNNQTAIHLMSTSEWK